MRYSATVIFTLRSPFLMPSHLPPSRLSENDMQIILQNQGRTQQM